MKLPPIALLFILSLVLTACTMQDNTQTNESIRSVNESTNANVISQETSSNNDRLTTTINNNQVDDNKSNENIYQETVQYTMPFVKNTLNQGEVVEVPIVMDTFGAYVGTGQVYIEYDRSKVRVKEISTASSDFAIWADKTDTGKEIRLSFAETGQGIRSRNAIIAHVTFEARNQGEAIFSFRTTQTIARNPQGANILDKETLEDIIINIQ